MMKIGLFGGSFDPVHLGHLNLAIELKERFSLDKILFCPSFISPFKQDKSAKAAENHRLEMLNLAIGQTDGFEVFDYELEQQEVSYTVKTLRHLKSLYQDSELFLLLGEDAVARFFDWKEVDLVLKLAKPLVGSRPGTLHKKFDKIPEVYQEMFEKNSCKIHNFEISSTFVRERLKKGLYCEHLVHLKVLDYIHQHQLYYNT